MPALVGGYAAFRVQLSLLCWFVLPLVHPHHTMDFPPLWNPSMPLSGVGLGPVQRHLRRGHHDPRRHVRGQHTGHRGVQPVRPHSRPRGQQGVQHRPLRVLPVAGRGPSTPPRTHTPHAPHTFQVHSLVTTPPNTPPRTRTAITQALRTRACTRALTLHSPLHPPSLNLNPRAPHAAHASGMPRPTGCVPV
jgi:hypothetical protein